MNEVVALKYCPQSRKKCGTSREFSGNGTTSSTQIKANLSEGDTCTYKMQVSNCDGAPAIGVNASENIVIDFIDTNNRKNMSYGEFK